MSAIAADTHLTEYTIYKLLKIATKEGIVASTRGRGGGIRLARDPHEITVGSVIRMFEPRFRECAPASLMRAQDARASDAEVRLDSALGAGIRAVLDTYDAITLIDLAGGEAHAGGDRDAKETGPSA